MQTQVASTDRWAWHLYPEGGGQKPLLLGGREWSLLVMFLKLILDEF